MGIHNANLWAMAHIWSTLLGITCVLALQSNGLDDRSVGISDNEVFVSNYIAIAPERRAKNDSYDSRAWIYVYKMEDGNLVYDENKSSDTPYVCFLPHMVFNLEQQALEVIGDW